MRTRTATQDMHAEIDHLIEVTCSPDLTAEDHALARARLHELAGHFAVPLQQLCTRLAATHRQLAMAERELARFTQGVRLRGIVTAADDRTVRVLLGQTERVLARPPDVAIAVGHTVLTDGNAHAIVAGGGELTGGQAYVFCQSLEERWALVRSLREGALEEARQMALVAASVDLEALRAGDRVLGWSLDGGNLVLITRHLGPLAAPIDEGASDDVVTRADIVGLEDILDETELLLLASELPAFARVLAAAASGATSLLFQGPPGTGKTLVARMLMQSVRARGGRALYRTASHYLVKFVGAGAALLREDAAMLEASYRETGVRPLLVIDELEAIALDRSHPMALTGGYVDVLGTLLSTISMSAGVRIVGISNVGDRFIDQALLRPGRMRVVVFPPTMAPEAAATLIARCLDGVEIIANGDATADPADRARLAGELLSDLVYAPSGELAELVRVQLADGRVLTFGAADLATPAALADGIVRPAILRSARRDLANGKREPSPLTLDELRTETVAYFVGRCATITRDNVKSHFPTRIPDDQAVAKVERVAQTAPPATRAAAA